MFHFGSLLCLISCTSLIALYRYESHDPTKSFYNKNQLKLLVNATLRAPNGIKYKYAIKLLKRGQC